MKIVAGALAVLLASVMTAGAATATATPAPAEPEGSLVGAAGGKLGEIFGPLAGDPVRFTVDAKGTPGKVGGTFHVLHTKPDGGAFAEFSGKVDCLVSAHGQAVVTGIVEREALPGLPPGTSIIGKRIGLSVDDRGRHGDRIGWSWFTGGFVSTLPCTSTVPFFTTTTGDYKVRSMF
ncbi:hypothetical protein NLX83_02895 [Allokutzneria sp. A3M-2-11 16]|uniref:hypothetical protein n=1 Tax=Allokutzneria sp. A3M-2-11 16 TaxID=2962043 RepID=UPI0020B83084|nr:hypothetical protein [Allokutzneria sp. A3M-2-11 16]MCP3798196.1 hypothetical protein [Allokutzneria sp. A3M-2-11 16]